MEHHSINTEPSSYGFEMRHFKRLDELTKLVCNRPGITFLFLDWGASYSPAEILKAITENNDEILSQCWIAHFSEDSFNLFTLNNWLLECLFPFKQDEEAIEWIESRIDKYESCLNVLNLEPGFIKLDYDDDSFMAAGFRTIKYAYHVHKFARENIYATA